MDVAVWQERWDQVWPLLTDYLPARDLICLCLSSSSLLNRLNSTGGWWQQACSSCLAWPPASSSSSGSSEGNAVASVPQPCRGSSGSDACAACMHSMQHKMLPALKMLEADQRAQQVLLSATALAHHVQHCRPTPAAIVQLPPWLPGQPGRGRGYVRVDPASLDPSLLLTPTELSLLSYGSLYGHTSGVFISSCSSSPRTQQPCAQLAVVVSDKALVAELYLPRDTAPIDPWAGILSPVPPVTGTSNSSSTSGSTTQHCDSRHSNSSSSSSTCPLELWLSSSVQLQPPQAAGASPKGQGRGGSRGARSSNRGRRGASSGNRGVFWADIHHLISKCIADNASRCRAARGTTVIPPGTSTAAAIEQDLLQLAAAGGPVLDLRRLSWEAAAAAGRQLAAAAALQQQQQRQQMQQRRPHSRRQGHQSGHAAGHTSLPSQQQQQQQKQQREQDQEQNGSQQPKARDAAGGQPHRATQAGGWGWQPAAMSAVQAALAAVHAAPAGPAAAAGAASGGTAAAAGAAAGGESVDEGADALDSDRPLLLAALVEKLPALVPDVQLLVLPVLLPSGRAAQRTPSVGGTRPSAPKLLCLNVPFLMALRLHAWERLPHLRHVLLMAGPPPPMAAPTAAPGEYAVRCGAALSPNSDGSGPYSPRPQHQQQLGQGSGQVVHGTFRLEDLEQQWQQQLQLGQVGPQQQQQVLWDEGQQDAWFEQQIAQQRPRQGASEGPQAPTAFRPQGQSLPGPFVEAHMGIAAAAERGADGGLGVVLSRAAVDALRDMVHSCMDR